MKKLFIAILGVAAFAACSQDVTLETPKGAAIGFDNVFVENATRAADLTANNITDFGVYGFIKNASGEGQIFDNQLVSKSGDAFTYSPAQYWVANADYYFAAVAPAAKAEGYAAVAETPDAGVLSFNNETAAANTDLLFAYYKRDAVAAIKEAPAPVAFTFDHVLSRVKFSFKNGFGEGQNIELKVTNVNVKNAIAKGTLALEAGVLAEQWADQTDTFNVAFGNAGATLAAAAKGTTEHFYLIPANAYEYNVTFDVTIYQAGVELDTYKRSAKVTVDLLRGNSYELTATLNASNVSDDGENALFPIEFTVDAVNEWVDAPVAATTLPEQIAGLTLVSDAVAGNLYLEGSFDGAGHTLTADVAATWTANGYLPFITTNGDSKISNLTIDGANHKVGEYGIRGVYFNGNLTLDNVTIKNVTYTMNDNGVAKTLTVVNSTLEGWTSYNPATVARFENVAFVSGGTYNTVRPHGTTTFKNCSFDGTTIDLSKLGADKEIKFIGCTYNGQPLAVADFEIPAGFVASVEGDVILVEKVVVAKTAEEFAAAVKANDKQINIVLNNDIDVAISSLGQITGGSGEYKLGGEATEAITIDLNGKKLNITTTYWSNLGAKNNNAVFTIKNGTMTSSQATGTWNSYDLTFSNCDYIFEDVVFEKAIAFDNTGKSASLKNVTIKESHDYYAMWITADGQNITVDNLTIESAGRGIKIDEQYRDTPAKVTLTVKNSKFTTAKKAAILVKSAAGAQINVENLDITNVAADSVNAVWVDSDSAAYYDLVTVTGGSKIQE